MRRIAQKVSCPGCGKFIGFIITEGMRKATGPQFSDEDGTPGCVGCSVMVAELARFMPIRRTTRVGHCNTPLEDVDAFAKAED